MSIQVFYGEFENEKKWGQKIFVLPQLGFEPRIFEQVPAHNLHGSLKISTLTAEKTNLKCTQKDAHQILNKSKRLQL